MHIGKVFFTYVWGGVGDPAWPLTFSNKAARTSARRLLADGDLVFTVGTKGEPTEAQYQGRVCGLFQLSDMEVNTIDYDMPKNLRSPEFDNVLKFPYALQPLRVWEILPHNNVFASLVGPLTPVQHLQAQTHLVELDRDLALPLLSLRRRQVALAYPKNEFGLARIKQKQSKLAPKHQGSFSGAFKDHSDWRVYTLVLRDRTGKTLAVKVGYAHDPAIRADGYNFPLANEVTGLRWDVDANQLVSSEDVAREVEQRILQKFSLNKLSSNGEILVGVHPTSVLAEIAQELKRMASVAE